MLMGEVPGDREDVEGHPFVGPAGRVLDEALANAGIDRESAYEILRGRAGSEPAGKPAAAKKPGFFQKILEAMSTSTVRALGSAIGRQISRGHAQAIAETGGSIGLWHFFPSLDKYVDGLKEMAEVVGVEHVSIGTDQSITPGGSMYDYAQWVQLVAAMLRGGFTPEETGKIAGGNYLRIFRTAVG